MSGSIETPGSCLGRKTRPSRRHQRCADRFGWQRKGTAAIEALIKQVIDQRVELVINTGGLDHRWLGNAYFKARGARIFASQAGVEGQRARLQTPSTASVRMA